MKEEIKSLMIFMLKKKLRKKLKSFNNNCKTLILLKKKNKVSLHSQLNNLRKLKNQLKKLKNKVKEKLKQKLKKSKRKMKFL
jgi:hypothetical protein